MRISNKAMIKASGFVLCGHLTEDILQGEEWELDDFLIQNAWEPFENYSANEIWCHIEDIAQSIQEGVK